MISISIMTIMMIRRKERKNTSMAVEVSDVSDSPAALQAVTLKQDDNDDE